VLMLGTSVVASFYWPRHEESTQVAERE
jgi:hypothetical protein